MASLSKPTRLAALLLCAWVSAVAWAQADVSQQQVEAAYLYKFGNYVTWPDKTFAAPDSPIVIGVADAGGLADELSGMVSGRVIGSRPLLVRRIRAGDSLAGVQILFVGSGAQDGGFFQSAHGHPILVVTEGKDGLALGGAVSFVVVDDRVRFDVSLDAVQQNGLKLSSQLLSVAHSVSGAGQ
jgi:hypothetical protein